VRIERIRIQGFGPLTGADLAWPEGKLVLVVDPNETGKTSLCEAVLAALFGLPRHRAGRARDVRKPRGGARFAVGLDIASADGRLSIDRDLETGTLRVIDRQNGEDATRDYLRSGGRDVLGERLTGLTESLFRSTAYVGQNRLDADELDSTLTVELARIADSGGGEASVVRALRVLQEARTKMPEAVTGPSVSVETEILRLTRKCEERSADSAKLAGARAAAAELSARLARLSGERAASVRRAALAEIAVAETERLALAARLAEIRAAEEARAALVAEASALEREASLFSEEALQAIDRVREERGGRPEALEKARGSLAAEEQRAVEERRPLSMRYGPLFGLGDEERVRLSALLASIVESARESATAEEALEAQWEELQREGLANDLKRLDALPPADRDFLQGAEEERRALELQIVQAERRVAEGSSGAAIAAGERRERVKRARGLVSLAALLVPLVLYLALPKPRVAMPAVAATAAFTAGLLLFGAVAWWRGSRHRRGDEARLKDEELAARAAAHQARQLLSGLRQNLDRIARGSGFGDAATLQKAHRRARAADEKRRVLLERRVRRDAILERREALALELDAFRAALSSPAGLPSVEDAQATLAILEELDRLHRTAREQAAARERESERLREEEAALAQLERVLRDALARVGVPRRLSLPEALLFVEAGRRRAHRRREILEVELPAREAALPGDDRVALAARVTALESEVARRLEGLGARSEELAVAETPEAARRAAEEARAAAREAEEACAAAERDLAARVRDGGERAREAEEGRAEADAQLRRAVLFRDALDVAREALASAASAAYGDFRRGLSEASRSILSAWRLPYEALEFADDLSVSAVARGGRLVTRIELAQALSTGAREQLHLIARLAALRYLGTGERGVPLLLDDPLVGCDDERFAAVMSFLAREVLDERPVLLVTCHAWRHERLLSLLPPDVRERIHQVTLTPSGGAGAPAPQFDAALGPA